MVDHTNDHTVKNAINVMESVVHILYHSIHKREGSFAGVTRNLGNDLTNVVSNFVKIDHHPPVYDINKKTHSVKNDLEW